MLSPNVHIFMRMLIMGQSHISVLFYSILFYHYILFIFVNIYNDFILFYVYDFYRCLCELAKQIGFQDQAQNIFQLEQQLSTFRHVVSIIFNFFLCNSINKKIINLFVSATRNGSTRYQICTIFEYRDKIKISISAHGSCSS